MFHYSKYWGTWSRVLQSEDGWYLEVNLTPINGRYDNSSQELWNEWVAPIILRRHCTAPQWGELKDKLPPMVVTAMIMNVGAELTRRLITADLLSELDLSVVRAKMRGGGIPLAECRRQVGDQLP
jgi:hypothetical protein